MTHEALPLAPQTLEQEYARAEQVYGQFADGVKAMAQNDVFPIAPHLNGLPDSLQIIDSAMLAPGIRGTHDYASGITTVAVGYTEAELFHELTHSQLGEFGFGNGGPSVLPVNEGITQILTRGIASGGEVILEPPAATDEAYADDQRAIVHMVERSNGAITFKDFLAVYCAPDTDKRQAFTKFIGKLGEVYPTDNGEGNILLDGMEVWYDVLKAAEPLWAEQGHPDKAKFLASLTASSVFLAHIDRQTAK